MQWLGANRGFYVLAVFEDEDTRDAGDAILRSDARVIVNVDFRHGDFVGVFLTHFF